MSRRVRMLAGGACLALTGVTGFAVTLASARTLAATPVPTPTVSVPSLPGPPVTVPTVTVPSVSTLPSVSTPSLPQPSLPAPSGSSGSSGSSSAGSHQATGGGSTGPAPPGAAAEVTGGLGGPPAASPVSTIPPSGAALKAGIGSAPAARRAGSDHHGGFTKRYLQRLVTELRGCLSVISSRYANVLALRTGWGSHRSYSRQSVARKLHVSLAREGRMERRAVNALSAASQHGSCARTAQANQTALFVAPGEQSLLAQPFPRAFLAAPARARSSTPHDRSKRRRQQSVSGASTGGVPGTIPSLPHPGSSSFPWLFVVVGLVAATALVSPLARRRMIGPRAAGAPGATVTRTAAAATAAAPAAQAGASDPAAASRLGARLERQGDIEGALAAYRRADAAGDAAAATNLGALLEQRGDHGGALAAYRRADERGDSNGSFNLGCLLAERGDTAGAIEALRRADERGDAAAASNLGVLLEQQGDLEGALEAYRRADQCGDANGSFNLGLLLGGRGDIEAAQQAYERALERGDPEVVDRARWALADLRENAGT